MARLYVFAEGRAEQTFANTVLRPHLARFQVYMRNAVLVAHAHKNHRTHRGGGRNFHAMQKDIVRLLKQDSGSDAFFTSMIDLYALHRNFPGAEEAEKRRHNPYERVAMLEQSWANATNDRRFIPHIQLHEYEAYLFVNLSVLCDYYEGGRRAIGQLQRSVESFASPELIDDGQQSAPSKRLVRYLPAYKNDKRTVGVQAAEQIGVSAIRCRCPHFSRWLERLEGLAARPVGSR